jgi:hypothetical protein
MTTVISATAARLAAMICAGLLAGGAAAQSLEGRWEGTLRVGDASLRLLLDVEIADDDLHLGTLTSLDQASAELPIDVIDLEGDRVTFEIRTIGARYQGRLADDAGSIRGAWSQGEPIPLDFARSEAVETQSAPAGEPAVAAVQAPLPEPFGPQLELSVPFMPPAFTANGATHLVYELHLSNLGFNALALRRIEVLDAGNDRLLARFERGELNSLLRLIGSIRRPGPSQARVTDLRQIPPGRRSVAFIWLTVPEGEQPPARLRHRVGVRDGVVEGAAAPVASADYAPLGAPLRGDNWLAVNGPGNAAVHRRALLALDGSTRIAQRFAIDWVKFDDDGSTYTGDPESNAAYHAWGEEVLAVADAVVAHVQDGIAENVPGLMSRAVPITLETLAGNNIVLDLGDGRYAFYAHLQPGSVRVRTGDRVARGDVIALVGNSGNSTEPHLHFHVANGPTLANEGLPYSFERFSVRDADGNPVQRRADLPMQNSVVRFPD